jgi:hypothetical protein
MSHTYRSEAPMPEQDRLLAGALRRLLAAAKRVQSASEFRAVAAAQPIHGGPRPALAPVPRTYDYVEAFVRKEFKRLRLFDERGSKTGRRD